MTKGLPQEEVETENPFAYGEGNPQQVITVTFNRKCHPITDYASRKHITLDQARAGLHFQALYSKSGAVCKAMDFRNEPVDGGGWGDAFTDVRHNSIKLLIEASNTLGRPGYLLVEQVCGHGVYVGEMTRNTRETTNEMRKLRQCLNILSKLWGFAQ